MDSLVIHQIVGLNVLAILSVPAIWPALTRNVEIHVLVLVARTLNVVLSATRQCVSAFLAMLVIHSQDVMCKNQFIFKNRLIHAFRVRAAQTLFARSNMVPHLVNVFLNISVILTRDVALNVFWTPIVHRIVLAYGTSVKIRVQELVARTLIVMLLITYHLAHVIQDTRVIRIVTVTFKDLNVRISISHSFIQLVHCSSFISLHCSDLKPVNESSINLFYDQ